jgi:2-keto-4-pentenoate hydratase
MTGAFDPAPLAARLEGAWTDRRPIAPPGAAGQLRTVEEAYAVQRAWAAHRASAGEVSVGRKIGLTSPGMQRQMGVDEPDFGDLWGSRRLEAVDGLAVCRADAFLQPRVEAELAFLLASDLAGPGVTEAAVAAATEAVALAIEVVDSRIEDWRITLVDTVADNASYGAFVTGEWSVALAAEDLAEVELTLRRSDEELVRERGSAVLGSPRRAVAWLANKLGSFGEGMRAGDVVLSGSVGGAVPATAGDEFEVAGAGRPPLRLRFE